MKLALISAGNVWFLPFLKIYTKILDDYNVAYDIISWNRDGTDDKIGKQYNKQSPLTKSRIRKLWDFIHYAKFVKRTIENEKYDKLIFFSAPISMYLLPFLKRKYKGKYIYDFRDLSIEQNKLLRRQFDKVLKNSAFNVVSSPGFKKCLNEDNDFVLCHNFDIDLANKGLASTVPIPSINPINVLTIGGIRDFDSNSQVINALSNKDGFCLEFVGKGIAKEALEDFSNGIGCKNIHFTGYYPKEDEPKYITDSSILNIFYPKIISHSTAMSNRFYHSIIFKRPMIVTKDSTQGDYVEKFNIGLAIEDTSNLDKLIKDWLERNDYMTYCKRANKLLGQFIEDQDVFKKRLLDFCRL